jgi:hypothetical protein
MFQLLQEYVFKVLGCSKIGSQNQWVSIFSGDEHRWVKDLKAEQQFFSRQRGWAHWDRGRWGFPVAGRKAENW